MKILTLKIEDQKTSQHISSVYNLDDENVIFDNDWADIISGMRDNLSKNL